MAGGGEDGVRAMGKAYLVLGLAAAGLALYAISLDPDTFRQLQLQVIKESDPHPPEQGQTDCAPTAAEVMQMRADAAVLLLLGTAQAVMAMVAVAGTTRVGTFLAAVLSVPMTMRLLNVLGGVLDLAIGLCHGHGSYHHVIVAGYVAIIASSVLLFIFGMHFAFRSRVPGSPPS